MSKYYRSMNFYAVTVLQSEEEMFNSSRGGAELGGGEIQYVVACLVFHL